jgi:hypothetical protein
MKSQSLHIVVVAFFLATAPISVVGQDKLDKADAMSQSEAKGLVQKSAEKKQVKTWIANAKTPADHNRIAAYFNREADRMDDEAKDHEYLAEVYRRSPGTSVGGKSGGGSMFRTAEHCESVAKSLCEAAKSLRELAGEHEQMAKDIGK